MDAVESEEKNGFSSSLLKTKFERRMKHATRREPIQKRLAHVSARKTANLFLWSEMTHVSPTMRRKLRHFVFFVLRKTIRQKAFSHPRAVRGPHIHRRQTSPSEVGAASVVATTEIDSNRIDSVQIKSTAATTSGAEEEVELNCTHCC